MIPLYEIRLLEDWLRDRAPPWFQDAPVGPEIEAYGALADEHLEYVATALRARYVELAPEDGLNLLGAERNFVRYPAESLDAFRQRIIGAWEFWQWAGTEYGLGLALSQLGYNSAIVPVRNYDNTRWSEFDVYLYAGTRSYDGSVEEKNRILAIINQVKPAHTRLATLRYVPSGPLNWNPAGLTWNPPGQVWGAPPVVLYP
ncbi:phage tail protein [Meiothermus cerbereus]|uniref:phage tail protein n=1 Tax=Meiothermus cerbereus TaxID=65552 RepID=UPI0004823914|nr:phage tail protein [Meiothermus cerbereus]